MKNNNMSEEELGQIVTMAKLKDTKAIMFFNTNQRFRFLILMGDDEYITDSEILYDSKISEYRYRRGQDFGIKHKSLETVLIYANKYKHYLFLENQYMNYTIGDGRFVSHIMKVIKDKIRLEKMICLKKDM